MFLGEYRLNVDGKGRLRLPAGIRRDFHALYAPDDAKLIMPTFWTSSSRRTIFSGRRSETWGRDVPTASRLFR